MAEPLANTPSVPDVAEPKPFTVCVFCGARSGNNPIYEETAISLAHVLHKNSWSLVYGGGTVGLMGAVARTLRSLGGSVHGILPQALVRLEQDGNLPAESEYGKITIVHDMHTRKAMMGKEADAFVVLPGGFGTMEEFFEVVTWNQLGIHGCPIVVINVGGFYDGLLGWIKTAIRDGFIGQNVESIIVEAKSTEEVEEKIKSYKPAEGRFDLDWSIQ
ncbi:hypothetical protein RUND412_007134 [Rhizina undulata]